MHVAFWCASVRKLGYLIDQGVDRRVVLNGSYRNRMEGGDWTTLVQGNR